MKITKSKLIQIIKEEVQKSISKKREVALEEGELEEGMAQSALVALALALSGPAMAGTPDVAPIQQTGDPSEAAVSPAALSALDAALKQLNVSPEDALEKIVDHEVDDFENSGSGE
jgi:hypothetical protein